MRKLLVLFCLFISVVVQAQDRYESSFENSQMKLSTIGRGECKIQNGVLESKDSYACFGNKLWKDYVVTFKARAPKGAEEVQIWSGFRALNRNDRYLLGFCGGKLNDLYLYRLGYMGTDEFLALRQLHFHPEPGTWYSFKIEVVDNRIRVYLNDEKLPRLDVVDNNATLVPSGQVTLGGGWIKTEFDDLKIEQLSSDYLSDVSSVEYEFPAFPVDKEKKRLAERAGYQPIKVDRINGTRTEISLNGNWLFMPDYEAKDEKEMANNAFPDEQWHIMPVPNFWNPIRIWLHGETMDGYPKGVSDPYYQKETARCENYTFDYKKTKAAWYRQWLDLPSDVKGKVMELDFDAVSKMADVYVNGTLVTRHIGMFGNFNADVSKLLNPGKNLIAVKVTRDYVENISDRSKIVDVAVSIPVTNAMLKDVAHGFYCEDEAGIWQPVSLIITNPLKIEDVYIKPNLTGAEMEVTLKNHSGFSQKVMILTDIRDKKDQLSLCQGESVKGIELKAGEERVVTYRIDHLKPKLWSPQHPNLYDFDVLVCRNGQPLDKKVVCSGFRTFESKNGFLYLNGIQYWLRGGNQCPSAIVPYDAEFADKFFQLMKAANIEVTRSHNAPYNELWVNAADRNGIGVSIEGTWPWLMISNSMPEKKFIEMWSKEYLSLVKKYRNHPSILMWTVNNEMDFEENDPDQERAKIKMGIISDVVKQMRQIDNTRLIVFDSNYRRNEKKFGTEFFKKIDDGDLDDIHYYPNWYKDTFFKQFNGEFQEKYRNEGRPLISQELSTGYSNNETGHAVRFYTIAHQTPQALIGNQAYPFANPNIFLKVHCLITKEIAEALRRTNDKASGFMHFSALTWFRDVYDAQKITPYPIYFGLKKALSPVLISAELWGRNFYAGEKLPTRICIVNDRSDGSVVTSSILKWSLVDDKGKNIIQGEEIIPEVKHSSRYWFTPSIRIPQALSADKVTLKLRLSLIERGKEISGNEYDLLVAQKSWAQQSVNTKTVLVDFNNTQHLFDFLKIPYRSALTIDNSLKMKAGLLVLAGMDIQKNCTKEDLVKIRSYITKGGKVLLLGSEEVTRMLYPEYIRETMVPDDGDIVSMEIPESPLFDGIDQTELRYFNNNKREVPTVCHSVMMINRDPHVTELASQLKIHGYKPIGVQVHSKYIKTIKGFSIIKISDQQGTVIVSTMAHEKAVTDPIMGRLLVNMIKLSTQDSVIPAASHRTGEVTADWIDRAQVTGGQKGPDGKSVLWYRNPASVWEEALPLGNGQLGAMVFGGVADERIQLNENSLWDGYSLDPNDSFSLSALPEVRHLLFSGKNNDAVKLAEQHMLGQPRRIKSYQSLGELWFDTPVLKASKYIRSLDLSTAIAKICYTAQGINYMREAFISHADKVLIVHLTASKKGQLNFSLTLKRQQDAVCKADSKDPNSLLLVGRLPIKDKSGEPRGMSFAVQVKAVARGGKTWVEGDLLHVTSADEITLFVVGATNYPGLKNLSSGLSVTDPGETCKQIIAQALGKGYNRLKIEHIGEHQSLFNRVDLHLGKVDPGILALPTDQRLALARKTGVPDAGLVGLFFQYGRYLLISSSRPGGMPANLQGLWAWQMTPPWNGDYHTNINVEMNYWPAEITNLPETHLPLFDLEDALVKPGEKTAKMIYGARGWVVHHLTDAWGFTAPADGPQGIWPMGAAWLSQHPWEHYCYTGDTTFLRERAYPLMKGAAWFILDFLVEAPVGTACAGKLVTNPSYSPENAFYLPNGEKSVFTYGATMDLEIIHDLLSHCIEACDILHLDVKFREECRKTLARLAPVRISPQTGRIMEWAEDYKETDPRHRHTSHLFGLYPGNQITMQGTPELAEAARKTLEVRGDGGAGWSLVWKVSMWNRLQNGNQAYKLLSVFLSQMTSANLFDTYMVFQIDGNLGVTAAIAEMMLQSQYRNPDGSYEIQLLPSLPSAFSNGSVKGLCARGGFVVDMVWQNGKVTKVKIFSKKGGKLNIVASGHRFSSVTALGETVYLNERLNRK